MQITFLTKRERVQKKHQDFVDYCNKIEETPEKVFLWFPKKVGQKLIWLESVIKTAKYDGYNCHKKCWDYQCYWKIIYIDPKIDKT